MRLHEIQAETAAEQRVRLLKSNAAAAEDRAKQLRTQANASADRSKMQKSAQALVQGTRSAAKSMIKPYS